MGDIISSILGKQQQFPFKVPFIYMQKWFRLVAMKAPFSSSKEKNLVVPGKLSKLSDWSKKPV